MGEHQSVGLSTGSLTNSLLTLTNSLLTLQFAKAPKEHRVLLHNVLLYVRS